jgi:hypothetical protein
VLHSRPPFWINMHLNGKVSLEDKHGEGKKDGSAMGWGAAQRVGGMRDG